MNEYDENKAVKAIGDALAAASRQAYDKGELLNIIDMIWDLYEDSGLLDIDSDAEDLEPDAIIAHVRQLLAKDRLSPIAPDDIPVIVRAELDYEASLDDF